MKLNKKLMAVLSVVMAGIFIAGCGTKKPATTETTDTGTSTAATTNSQADVIANAYSILVVDGNDNPVSDVTVKFCTDTMCRLGKTGEDGVAVFDTDAPGKYSVHIMDAPEGFTVDEDEEFFTEEKYGLLKIKLDGTITAEAAEAAKTYDFPNTGFSIRPTDEMENRKGTLEIYDMGFYGNNPGYYFGLLAYTSHTRDEINAILQEYDNLDTEDAEAVAAYTEKVNAFNSSINGPVFYIVGIDEAKNGSLDEILNDPDINPGYITSQLKFGSAGGYTYYILGIDYDKVVEIRKPTVFPEEYVAEYKKLLDTDLQTYANLITLTGPKKQLSFDNGSVLDINLTDMDGNPVTIKDLCAGHKVTMINCWGTWCGYCVAELPDLEELNKEFEAQDCQIVGICENGWKEGKKELAQKQLKEAGVTFTNVLGYEGFSEDLSISGYPTSFFVDSEGRVLTSHPVSDASIEKYKAALKEALGNLEK